jgi:hypothetical protein
LPRFADTIKKVFANLDGAKKSSDKPGQLDVAALCLAKSLDSSAPSAEEIAAHDYQGSPRQPRVHERDLQSKESRKNKFTVVA